MGERKSWQTVVVAAALVFAASCSDDPTSSAERVPAPTTVRAPSAVSESGAELTLQVVDVDPVSGLITDHRGFAVYGNRAETPDALICLDACTDVWTPLTRRDAAVSDRLDIDLFDTLERPDGTEQVVYDGVVLYLWTGDRDVGIAAGAGVAGTWFALTADGETIG